MQYFNKDLYLSAFLMCQGFELTDFYRENSVTTFVFEKTDNLDNAVRAYHSLKSSVEPVRYKDSLKSMKTLVHTINNNYNSKENSNEYTSTRTAKN